MIVAVGSLNPVKIQATLNAFKKFWPDKSWKIIGIETPSGVSDQPMSDNEYIKGAFKKIKADFGVGLEGGL